VKTQRVVVGPGDELVIGKGKKRVVVNFKELTIVDVGRRKDARVRLVRHDWHDAEKILEKRKLK